MFALSDRRALAGICAAIISLAPAIGRAEDVGNARDGLDYARAHCAECHAVEKSNDIVINQDAPNFVDVANTPGMTERALGAWLQTSHPTMPNFIIPVEAKNDLIAYILSLKAR